jgi:hypothetical protein
MTSTPSCRAPLRLAVLGLAALGALGLLAWVPACSLRAPRPVERAGDGLPRAQFAALIQSVSEEDGYFHSDNFTSNETSYLHVVDALRELGVEGGAYIGVGPEQNFTYIAQVRPRIAFIVDIRRQAILQHLMYKALFEASSTRAEFLSRLLSRPLSAEDLPPPTLEALLDRLGQTAAPPEVYEANHAALLRAIERDFGLPLSEQDRRQLEHVASSFWKEGLDISFRFGQSGWGSYRRFPSLRELILERDLRGRPGNFLASEEDYRFVRGLHLGNRIVPVVGDFAGSRALASLGAYLREHGHTVRAFYTSNVEQFLFQNDVFAAFVRNVRTLPIDERSVFIRAVPTRGEPHPALVPGHRTTTLLQKMAVFLADYDAGAYPDYRRLVTTHFIAGRSPSSPSSNP